MLRAALLAFALILISAVGASAATVTIAPSSGGADRTLTLADLAGSYDVHGASYTVRAADGTTTTQTVADGISLNALLAAAGIARDAFGYLTVSGTGFASALVIADDLGGTDQGPPVVWSDDQGLHFLRPLRNAHDVNAGDLVTAPSGELTLQLATGDPVKPQASVSTLHARVGEAVDFSASLAVGALRDGWGYAWYFGDGSGLIPGASVTHRFRKAGTYPVQVNVVDASGQTIGPAGVVPLRVVALRQRPSHAAHRADEGRGGGSAPGGDGGGGNGAAQTGAGAGASDAPVAPRTSAPASPVVPQRTPVPRRPPHRTPPGELVSGTLLASASAAAAPVPAVASGRAAASAAARGAAADGPLHVPVGVWVAIGLVVLLALGWALESRHTLPFWQP